MKLPQCSVLFCKSRLSKMASIKTNKNKKRTPLLKTNFSWLATLSLGPKRFLHSKGPKNAICLWLSHDKWHCTFNQQCSWSWLSQRQIAFFGPSEWRNLFRPKDKVSSYEKLVLESGVHFLFLFVLMDAILLKLDLQKRTSVLDNPPNGKLFV